MGVKNVIRRLPRLRSREFSGEFAVAGGAITAGTVKFGGEVTVVRNGAGLYTFTIVDGKQGRLADVDTFVVALSGATNGGWSWSVAADNIASAGTFQIQYQQQSFAAADPSGTVKVWFLTEGEAA